MLTLPLGEALVCMLHQCTQKVNPVCWISSPSCLYNLTAPVFMRSGKFPAEKRENLMIKGSCEEQRDGHLEVDVRTGDAVHNNAKFVFGKTDPNFTHHMRTLEELFLRPPPAGAVIRNDTKRLQFRTYLALRGSDVQQVPCENYFSPLWVDRSHKSQKATVGYYLQPPTPCSPKRKRVNRLMRMKSSRREYVLSKWQQKLLASQKGVSPSARSKERLHLSPSAIKNDRKRFAKKIEVRNFDTPTRYWSSDDEVDESTFQRYHRLAKISTKLPPEIIQHISDALDGDCDRTDLDIMIDNERERRAHMNSKRKWRRLKGVVAKWVYKHINNQKTVEFIHKSGDPSKPGIQPQVGQETKAMFMSIVSTLVTKTFGSDTIDYEKVLYQLEHIFDTLLLMYHSKSWLWALYQLKVYLTTTFEVSLAYKAYDYIAALFTSDECEVEPQSGDESRFNFKRIFGDWKGVIYGEFLAKVMKAIACLVSLGFCSLSNIPFCTDRFEKFHKESGMASKSWPDLITCVIETVIFVFERCVNWFTGKCKFMDIISSPSMAYSYDKEFAFLSANIGLYELNELDKVSIQRHEYEARLEDMMNMTKSFYEKSSGPEKRVMSLNMRELHRLQTKVICSTQAMTLREAPFSFYLYGLSGIGKTAMTNIIVNALTRANGYNPDKKYICSINASDAYQSELQPWHTTIFCDDLGNTKAEHELGCSTQLVIDYVNNNPKCALKADVDSKGKVLIKPKIFCATTNVKEVEAHVKSNEPLSILRRLNICITMVVKPEFRKPGSHFLDPAKMTQHINDAWLFTLEEAVPIAKPQDDVGASRHHWKVLKHGGRELKDVSINVLLKYLIQRSREHFAQQALLLSSIDAIHEQSLCEHDTYASVCNICSLQDQDLNIQAGDEQSFDSVFKYLQELKGWWFVLYDYRFPWFNRSEGTRWIYNKFVRCEDPAQIKRRYNLLTALAVASTFGVVYGAGATLSFMIGWTLVTYGLVLYYFVMCYIHDMLERARKQSLTMMQPLIQHKYKIAAGLSAVAIVVAIVKRLRPVAPLMKHVFDTQGSQHCTPQPDLVQRENVWVKPYVEKPPHTIEVKTATVEQLDAVIQDCLAYARMTFDDSDVVNVCCAFPLCGNTWIMPYHALRKNYSYIEIIRRPSGVSSNRKCRISKSSWLRVGESDLALISLPSAGDNRDLLPFFPNISSFSYEPVKWISKDKHADVCVDKFLAEFKSVDFVDKKGDHYNYDGWYYNMSFPTGTGMCMSVLLSQGKFPYIMGFHSAGVDGECMGVGHYVKRDDLRKALEALYDRRVGDSSNINIQVHNTGNMNLEFPSHGIRHTGVLHHKSPFNFFEKPGCALLYGAHTGMRRHFTSAVVPTYISDSVDRHLGIPRMHGRPENINNWKPWQLDAQAVTTALNMDLDMLALAYTDLETHIHRFLEDNQHYKEIICPMSRVATLSGVDGCRGIDAIKLATSAGFPRCKPKRNYVFETDDIHENITRPLDVSPEIWEDIEKIKETLIRGERVYFIHRINLKDEPTKLGKEKVRTFAGCTLECLILIRMYFLPIAKMMMDNTEVFECAIGVNAHGPDWTRLTNHMQKHGADRTIAGDYKSFDSMMWCYIVLLAFSILIGIAEWANYDNDQIMIMKGIATELAYGLTEYNGEYAMFLAQNLSGHGLTVFINNLANQLYMRYAYYDIYHAIINNNVEWLHGLQIHLQLDDASFDKWIKEFLSVSPTDVIDMFANNVSLICYGDDNKMSVNKRINFFNHCTVSYSLSRCGVTYTMADKESKSVPFIHSSECSFLKRHSVWSEEFEQYLAPLELTSLIKTLHSCIKSKELSERQQSAEALDSVMRELFYHGEQVFNEWRNKLQCVIEECDLTGFFRTGSLHTYEFLKSEYIAKYLSASDIKNSPASTPIDEIAKNGLLNLDTQCFAIREVIAEYKAGLVEGSVCYLAQSSPAQQLHPRAGHNLKQYVVSVQVAENNNQQDKVNTINSMMGPQQHQNVVFRDGTPQWLSGISGAYDDTRKVGMDQTVPLDQFFSRPIKFDLPVWTPGSASPYSSILSPWLDFFTNPRVSNRINNYSLLQATLKVKFVINGNPFYYGRLMADYVPLAPFRTLDNLNTLNRTNLISASQRSHIYINPTTSQGGVLELPFVWPKNAIRLTTPDLTGMGDIRLREVNPLKHANASTTPVSITAYIWAENVRLSVPTTQPTYLLTAQAGDEYGSGPVSGVATAVAKAAGALERVPIIGPYARATSMAAGTVSSVAKMMGFSRPLQIENSTKMIPKPVARLANTDAGDTSEKLTIDSKQELTVDPRVVGADTGDEMAIRTIAGKESYLTTFNWPVTATADQLLWNIRVTPALAKRDFDYTVDEAYQLPACSFAALPFQYWRGSMKYRFQIVCSDYHRGRLKFSYDPVAVAAGTQSESNIVYNRVVDISNETDFTMTVSWGQERTYLFLDRDFSVMAIQDSNVALGVPAVISSNGVLSVYVINDLTTPNSTINNDIQINVSVSLCDDCEFQAPDTILDRLSLTPQDGEESHDTSADVTDNAPTRIQEDDSVMECNDVDYTNHVYFGESVMNFRTLLKRFNFHRSYWLPATVRSIFDFVLPDYPFYRGISATGIDSLTGGTQTGYVVKTTLLTYLAPAFLTMRGGFRWKHHYVSDVERGRLGNFRVTRFPNVVDRANRYNLTTNNVSTAGTPVGHALAFDLQFSNGHTGTMLSSLAQQPVMEVELPNYNYDRFTIPKQGNMIGAYSPWVNWHKLEFVGVATTRSWIDSYVSTAEDFSLSVFQGCPPICVKTLVA